MKFLLFQIYAPFQAWGSPLPGNVRKVDDHPSKSGIMGFIANCLGLTDDMEDTFIDLSQSLGFACREDLSGHLTRDFHVVQANPPKDNIVSERFYLTDAAFTICVWDRKGNIDLDTIAEALNKPLRAAFLGRKCCANAIPPNATVIEAKWLVEAFDEYSPSKFLPLINEMQTLYWEGDSGMSPQWTIRRHDQPIGIRRRVARIESVAVMKGGHNVSE